MSPRRRPVLLLLSVGTLVPAGLAPACSLLTNVNEYLCPQDAPDCDSSPASGTGGDGSSTGGSESTGGAESGGAGGEPEAGGSPNVGGIGGCSGIDCAPSDDGCPAYRELELLYQNGLPRLLDDRIRPHFRVRNRSPQNVPFADLEIRYYFTEDAGSGVNYECNFAFKTTKEDGCANLVKGKTSALFADRTNTVLSMTFTDEAPVLKPNELSDEIKGLIQTFGDDFDQSNDYSFSDAPRHTDNDAYDTWGRVTLYCKGRLIWGAEPE